MRLGELPEVLSKRYTKEVSIQLFGEVDGDRLWCKHFSFHSESNIFIFINKFDSFCDGKYSHLFPILQNWLDENIKDILSKCGYM